jgi:uncharacterized membrane protein
MQFMWADTLLAAERAHLLRVVFWGGASVLTGTSVMLFVRVRNLHSTLLDQFAIQLCGWGAIELVLGAAQLRVLGLRDLASATQLDRLLWLSIGLDCGFVVLGLTLVILGWRLARRAGLIGAGIGVMVQASALAVLDLVLAIRISR